MIQFLRGASLLLMAACLLADARAASAQSDNVFRPVSFQTLTPAKTRAFSADFYVDDRDRDPQGIDVFDVGFRFRFQLGEKTELFTDIVADRVVALPESPAIPSSPRDLIFIGSIQPIPNAFNGQHPYVDKRAKARFDAFIPGTATVGATRTLRTEGIALGVSGAVVIPMARSVNALRSGSSSGSLDFVVAGLVSRELLGGTAHGRVGFTLAGNGSLPDRSFSVSGGTVTTVETRLPIGNRLDLGLAYVRPVTHSLALAAEARMTKEFVGDQRIDAVSPLDVMIGVHKHFGRFELAASLLNHFRPLPSGELRANPLAGQIDLSHSSLADRNAFLTRIGLGSVISQLRDESHSVVIGSSSTALPPGASRIAPTYGIRSEHNLGYIFTLTFRP
ncbi:MAG: hypothetical protein ABI672_16475 [Vicinamibacteria bacterium]